jgi:hypothetical protein
MKYIYFALISVFLSACSPDIFNMNNILIEHKTKYELMTVQDTYKLMYQSVFGIKHLLHDTTASKKYLNEEINSIEPKDEPLFENISPNGDVIRINLKSFKYRRLNPDILFEVMKISAREINGKNNQFEENWKSFEKAVIEKSIRFSKEELDSFSFKIGNEIKEMHHSPVYVKKYKPAYRVVKKDVFLKYFPETK